MRELDFSDFLLLIVLLSLAAFLTALFLVIMPEPTGMITVHGGSFARADFTVFEDDTSGKWAFLIGNLSSEGIDSLEVTGGDSYEVGIAGSHYSWIIASGHPSVDIASLLPAEPSSLDAYMGIDPAGITSASNTFREFINFSIGPYAYEAWSLSTNSLSGDFVTVLFNDTEGFIFVTISVPGGRGYDGSDADFQMMLPVPYAGYSYHLNTYSNATLDCSMPLGLTADIIGNSTYLSWDEVPGALWYNLYSIDDITDPSNSSRYRFDFSSSSPEIVYGNEYTDHEVGFLERYYSVRPVAGVTECQAEEIAGRINIPLVRTDSTAYNFITIPFILPHSNFTRLITPIMHDFRQAFRYNNSHKFYTDYSLFCFMDICVPFDNIGPVENHVSYWIDVHRNTTLPIAGIVKKDTYMSLSPQYNAGGFHVIEGERGAASVFNSTFPILNSVFEYDNKKKLYTQFSLFCFMDICVPIGSLERAEHVSSYWIDVKSEGDLEWP